MGDVVVYLLVFVWKKTSFVQRSSPKRLLILSLDLVDISLCIVVEVGLLIDQHHA